MLIASKEIKAVIFDLDGTLIDSSNIWSEIDKAFFAKRNMEIPPTYVDDIAHIGLKEAAIYTKNTYNIKESIEEIMDEWKQGTLKHYKELVPLKPNALELIKKLKDLIFHVLVMPQQFILFYGSNFHLPCIRVTW